MFKNSRKEPSLETAPAVSKRSPQSFIKAAESFEKSKSDDLKASRKFAWVIAGLASLIGVIGVITALVALLMRTEPEPMVLKVDNSTGATTVMRSVRDSTDRFDETVDKYWLAQYIRACESYDWFQISDTFEACKLMSESDVAKEFSNRVQAPTAPLNVLKDKGKIVAKIVSVVLLDKSAQVRFTT